MKATVTLLILFWMTCLGASERPPGPEPRRAVAPPATLTPDQLAAMIRLRGKPGKPSTNVTTATRNDDGQGLRVAALAPAFNGVTHSGKPRFWWHQSADTDAGELEFVLTVIRPSGATEMLRVELPARKAGHHFIDLADPKINPGQLELEEGGLYQWTIHLRLERGAKAVFCRLKREPAGETPADPAGKIRSLNESGNWYELFDTAAIQAGEGDPEWIRARDSLIEWIGLAAEKEP